jgi:hypothetical protein
MTTRETSTQQPSPSGGSTPVPAVVPVHRTDRLERDVGGQAGVAQPSAIRSASTRWSLATSTRMAPLRAGGGDIGATAAVALLSPAEA